MWEVGFEPTTVLRNTSRFLVPACHLHILTCKPIIAVFVFFYLCRNKNKMEKMKNKHHSLSGTFNQVSNERTNCSTLEPQTGLEPATSWLQIRPSTIEILRHSPGKFPCLVCNYVTALPDNSNPSLTRSRPFKIFGDPSGARTRKFQLEGLVTISSLSMGPYNPIIYSIQTNILHNSSTLLVGRCCHTWLSSTPQTFVSFRWIGVCLLTFQLLMCSQLRTYLRTSILSKQTRSLNSLQSNN